MFRTVGLISLLFASTAAAQSIELQLRTRVQPFKGVDEWKEQSINRSFEPSKTAVVLCDIWDKHWCDSATKRCDVIARRANEVVTACRARGMFIVHCPSDTMAFYQGSAARKRMSEFPKVEFPKAIVIPDPPLPIDDSDGGCDDNPAPKSYRAWKRQHPAIVIDEEKDGVTDQGQELYNAMKAKGITNLIVMGVHTNMCVLHRTFAIKQMTRSGIACVLVRDLTDAMYNPLRRPMVTHEEGTELVIQHIEKHWAPTCLAKDLLPRK